MSSSAAAAVTSAASVSTDLSSACSSDLIRGGDMPLCSRRSLGDTVAATASSLAQLEAFLRKEDDSVVPADLSGIDDHEDDSVAPSDLSGIGIHRNDSILEELRRLHGSEELLRTELDGLGLADVADGPWKDDEGDCPPSDEGDCPPSDEGDCPQSDEDDGNGHEGKAGVKRVRWRPRKDDTTAAKKGGATKKMEKKGSSVQAAAEVEKDSPSEDNESNVVPKPVGPQSAALSSAPVLPSFETFTLQEWQQTQVLVQLLQKRVHNLEDLLQQQKKSHEKLLKSTEDQIWKEIELDDGVGGACFQHCANDDDNDDGDSMHLRGFETHHPAAHISPSRIGASAIVPQSPPPSIVSAFRVSAAAAPFVAGEPSVISSRRRRCRGSGPSQVDLAGFDQYVSRREAKLEDNEKSPPPTPVSTEGGSSLSAVTTHRMPPIPQLPDLAGLRKEEEETSADEAMDSELIGLEIEFDTSDYQTTAITTKTAQSEEAAGMFGLLNSSRRRAERAAAEMLYGGNKDGERDGLGVGPYRVAAGIAVLGWTIAEWTYFHNGTMI